MIRELVHLAMIVIGSVVLVHALNRRGWSERDMIWLSAALALLIAGMRR